MHRYEGRSEHGEAPCRSRGFVCSLLLLSACASTNTSGDAEAGDESTSVATDDGEGSTSAGAADCRTPAPAASVDVVQAVDGGELFGTWTTPNGCPPFATVVFHVGSGGTDRDGNSMGAKGSNDGHLQLAAVLQDAGIASLRYDKRGVAASDDAVADPETLTIHAYEHDLVAWIEGLRQRPDMVGPITVLGHSEGALIGTLAAEQIPVDALILAAGAGRPIGELLRLQIEQVYDEPLRSEALEILATLEQGHRVDEVPRELAGLFAPRLQPYLFSWFALDPAAELAHVRAPTTILAGGEDMQVPVEDAEILFAAKPDATLRIIGHMAHTLKDASRGQDAAYLDPTVPLAPGFTDAVLAGVAR